MGTSYNPQIVKDNLILYLDAGNKKSYPGSGSTWIDLTKSKFNGVISSATYSSSVGGNFSFVAANSAYVTTNFSATCSSATMCVWLYRNSSLGAYTGILFSRAAFAHGIDTHGTNTNNLTYCWNSDPSTYSWDSGITIPLQKWTHITLVVSSTSAIYYINSVLRATNSVSHSSATFSGLTVGNDPGTGRYLDGSIAMCSFYNSALSAYQILQNYNATKGRFGL